MAKVVDFDLVQYLNDGVRRIVQGAVKASFSNPAETMFLSSYLRASKAAEKKRRQWAEKGLHIPAFLIASITSSCNLHCRGCYARANHACGDGPVKEQLSADQWGGIFTEAEALGVGFILLAGGEPLVRHDVLEEAAKKPHILFPVFTNGTMIGDERAAFFSRHRNLVPILSIEGRRDTTDERRGEGVYDRLQQAMAKLAKEKVLFGASVTVTTKNEAEVISPDFVRELYQKGCKVVIYVEYVPTDGSSLELAPDDAARLRFADGLRELRQTFDDMLFVAFPVTKKFRRLFGSGTGIFSHQFPWRCGTVPLFPLFRYEFERGISS